MRGFTFTYKGRKFVNYDSSDEETLQQLKEQLNATDEEINELLRRLVIEQLISFTDQYFYNEAKKRDYLNMGEILYDAQANPPDPDAVFLKKLYNAIWAKEEELENQLKSMSLEELLNLNLRNWAYKQYEEIKRGLENEK